jgi:succinate dehydrogenase / fumarate reductase cytochrome b subunit
MKQEESVKNSNPKGHPHQAAMTRSVVAGSSVVALWRTMIGKKVVMAITGAVLVGFVIVHMVGNLKIFSGPEEINAYSRFLREVGSPGLSYEQLLWLVRIVLLVCVALHITAAIPLTRMSWAGRPDGYILKRDIETTFAARMMRWGGVLLAIFIVFHILDFTLGAVGFSPGQFKDLQVYENVVAGLSVWPVAVFYIVAWARCVCTLTRGSGACCRRWAAPSFGLVFYFFLKFLTREISQNLAATNDWEKANAAAPTGRCHDSARSSSQST